MKVLRNLPFINLVLLFFTVFIFFPPPIAALQAPYSSLFNRGISWFDPGCTNVGSETSVEPGPVYVLGDSITAGIETKLDAGLKFAQWTPLINGQNSRTISGGIEAVEQDKLFVKTATAVVIQLGTNTSGFSVETIKEMLVKVREQAPAASIYWVDTAVSGTPANNPGLPESLSAVNQYIYEASRTENFRVVPWYQLVFGLGAVPEAINPSLPDSNGFLNTADGLNVHPTAAGGDALTQLILKEVTTGGGLGTPTGADKADDNCACNVPGLGADELDGHRLPAPQGGTGSEEPINEQGQVPSTGGKVTFSGNASLGQEYRDYYITMRWRYVLWNWNGGSISPGPETIEFYQNAPRVLVTNPRTGKSIIAVVLESGPAPWTGVDSGPNNSPKQGWTNPQDGTPAEYKGRVSGFPPVAREALEAAQRMADGSGDDLAYTWAQDQNATPGPVAGSGAGAVGTQCPVATGAGCPADVPECPKPTVQCSPLAGQDALPAPVKLDGNAPGLDIIPEITYQGAVVNNKGVRADVAQCVYNMITDAKNAGVTLTADNSFRDVAQQQALYDKYLSGSGNLAAPPGKSNHGWGVAIDFNNCGYSSPCHVWLSQNGANYGFSNQVAGEPWHWSITGH